MYKKFFKRIFDVASSLLVLILLSPMLIWLAYKIRKNLGSPVLFTQIRPGKDNKLFRLYKFRSMTDACDEYGNLLPDDQRMTDFGRRLRASSLDELPELINIIKGDMSVVGPRPQLVRDMVFFTKAEMQRQSVRPGLTGLAQISGRNNIDWKKRFHYDLQYIKDITFLKDMQIIWRTLFKVGDQEDIVTDGMETSEDYGDWLLRRQMLTKADYAQGQEKATQLIKTWERG